LEESFPTFPFLLPNVILFYITIHQLYIHTRSEIKDTTFPTEIPAQLEKRKMSDWGPVFISVLLFILLSPGLLFQLPGKARVVEFGTFQTSGIAILVHAIIYFALIAIFLLAIGVHVYMG
jgi:Protein of unknown function (DUF3339)